MIIVMQEVATHAIPGKSIQEISEITGLKINIKS